MLVLSRHTKQLDIGSRIRLAREAAGVNQFELSKIAGLGGGVLSNVENGRSAPSLITLAAVAEALHVSINWLIYGNHPPKADRELMRKLVLFEKRLEE